MERAKPKRLEKLAQITANAKRHFKSEECFRWPFEFAPDACFLTDTKGRFIYGNRAVEKLTRQKRKELWGKKFLKLSLFPQEQRDKVASILYKGKLRQNTGPDELIFKRNGSEPINIMLRTFPIELEDEALVLGIARNITNQKKTEETVAKTKEELSLNTAKLAELSDSLTHQIDERKCAENKLGELEQNLINILGNARLGVAIVSEDYTDLLYANRAYQDIFGYDSIEEMLAVPRKGRLTPDSYAQSLERMEKRRLGQRVPIIYNKEILRKDGKTRHVEVHAVNSLWQNKNCSLLYIEDITKRKEVEETFRGNNAWLQLLLSQVPCELWTTDSELRFTSVLGAEIADRGHFTPPHTGMDVFEYLETEDAEHPVIAAHHKALKGRFSAFELERGGINLDVRVAPLRDTPGHIIGVVGVVFDATDRKNTEVQLRSLASRLVEAQEEERHMIARELHDELGQSLTVLHLLLARAARTIPKNNSAVYDEAQAVVKDMIARVRRLSLDLRPSMLDDLGLLPTLLEYFKRHSTGTGLTVNFKHTGLSKKKFPVTISSTAYRIVQESLTNVMRHAGVDSANVIAWADHITLIVRIEDNGAGFDPAKLAIGKSCGLQGIRERVRLLGGNLEIESAPGKGTRVIAELPLPESSEN